MKLRLQSNSIRLRLKRTEVAQVAQSGRLEEQIIIGPLPGDLFRYVLESSTAATRPTALLQGNQLLIQVPLETISQWAAGHEVGIEAQVPAGNQPLQILIEKDFACLDKSDAENLDTYPHPLAGTKC